jgi:hypothetical protein
MRPAHFEPWNVVIQLPLLRLVAGSLPMRYHNGSTVSSGDIVSVAVASGTPEARVVMLGDRSAIPGLAEDRETPQIRLNCDRMVRPEPVLA